MAACRPYPVPPVNHLANGKFYMPQRHGPEDRAGVYRATLGQDVHYYDVQQPYHRYGVSPSNTGRPEGPISEYPASIAEEMPLSPGDRVRIRIADGALFQGDYEVNVDGTLQLPYLTPLQAAGRTLRQVEHTLKQTLVAEGLFQPRFVQVSVRHLYWGPIQVHVSGAVFQPGQAMLNHRTPEERVQRLTQDGGEYAPLRTVSAALQAAGGVRPDADVQRIGIWRGSKRWVVDFSGIFDGKRVLDPPLAAGDQIVIESTGEFQADLVRPSQITPPGIAVFLSNLTTPANSNSGSEITNETIRMPYGTRLLQGAVAANCVGGTSAVNSNRYVILASYNPITRQSEVIERSVEYLMRDARRDEFNPYLLSGDALACYDSVATNIRDMARTIADVLLPFTVLAIFR